MKHTSPFQLPIFFITNLFLRNFSVWFGRRYRGYFWLTNWISRMEDISRQEAELGVQREKVLDMSETSEGSQLFPLIVSNLIVEKIQIGFSSGDVNPLENVPLFDKSGKISRIEPDMNLCFPSTHREVILRWYNTEPLLQEEAIREWEKKYNT